MGSVISRAKFLRAALKQLLALSKSYENLLKRIEASPGLPVPGPTRSFWMDVESPISSRLPEILPEHSDVVVIGSGITGTAAARTLLGQAPLKVVMLEARDACSGATGRNGGHIKPPLHHDYTVLKRKHGMQQAKAIIKFRLAHVGELLRVAAEEDILKESQCREVDSIDVYFDPVQFEEAKQQVQEWKADMPHEARDTITVEGIEARDKFHLASTVAGVVYNQAGAIHPYRFVTSILERLLEEHDKNFYLSTHTPCTAILPPSSGCPFYTVVTPRGTITTPHVVHATNAWTSHLLQPMRTKIFPVRGNMTAQRPGSSLSPSSLDGQRSWVFYDEHVGYDYLTQLPNGENELMFGGGFFQGQDDLSELGITSDDSYSASISSHLSGALPVLFGEGNWGAEKAPAAVENGSRKWFDGRVKALWSGIIGISADGLPWVGRLPPTVAGRKQPPTQSAPACTHGKESLSRKTAEPGEWLAAGYSGEGMAHAYMSGKALAFMLLDLEEEANLSEWLPDVMRVTVNRWKKAKVEDLLEELD